MQLALVTEGMITAAIEARTSASFVSIEHEDRLVAPEAGIAASAGTLRPARLG